jgi:hypothetical protein
VAAVADHREGRVAAGVDQHGPRTAEVHLTGDLHVGEPDTELLDGGVDQFLEPRAYGPLDLVDGLERGEAAAAPVVVERGDDAHGCPAHPALRHGVAERGAAVCGAVVADDDAGGSHTSTVRPDALDGQCRTHPCAGSKVPSRWHVHRPFRRRVRDLGLWDRPPGRRRLKA